MSSYYKAEELNKFLGKRVRVWLYGKYPFQFLTGMFVKPNECECPYGVQCSEFFTIGLCKLDIKKIMEYPFDGGVE